MNGAAAVVLARDAGPARSYARVVATASGARRALFSQGTVRTTPMLLSLLALLVLLAKNRAPVPGTKT